MCGICGIIKFNGIVDPIDLSNMIGTLSHRGPDNTSISILKNEKASIGFAHARLSIIDLSEEANQPMVYSKYHIVFNGEIYNFREIRDELIKFGHKFILDSDTEVILHAFEEWGTKCVDHFIGMFVFVIYDADHNKVYFFRDRAGIKPLFYYFKNDMLIFGSELKVLMAHPEFKKEINSASVGLYFKFGFVPSPLSIFKDTYKLNPGSFATLSLNNKEISYEKYWSVETFYNKSKSPKKYEEAREELHNLLISSCEYRMVADVPVGVFLSGGYDSTAVAAILAKNNRGKLKTFTIGFEEGNNEAPFAKEIAEFLGTEHTEFICTTKEAQDLIPDLPYYYDEPFADSSAIPTMLVSKLAKKHVTVALSADAGDELFCGYNGYRSIDRNIKTLAKFSWLNDRVTSFILASLSIFLKRESFLSHKINSLISILKVKGEQRVSVLHEQMQSLSSNTFKGLLRNIDYPENVLVENGSLFNDSLSVAMAIDYKNYLQNDILTKVDRATMSASLEGREPFVDHRILEFSAQLPIEYKFDGIQTKRILKDIVHKYIPKAMMDRPKTGFSLPIYSWLRDDLSFLLEEYLNDKALEETGIFNISYVDSLLVQFKNRKLHDESIIWKILQFQMWFKLWIH